MPKQLLLSAVRFAHPSFAHSLADLILPDVWFSTFWYHVIGIKVRFCIYPQTAHMKVSTSIEAGALGSSNKYPLYEPPISWLYETAMLFLKNKIAISPMHLHQVLSKQELRWGSALRWSIFQVTHIHVRLRKLYINTVLDVIWKLTIAWSELSHGIWLWSLTQFKQVKSGENCFKFA